MDKVIFHVVNSIKGGCGKSTFSLLLADYYQTLYRKDYPEDSSENAFIIDLDWFGTSWQKNYENYFENNNAKFINELMFDFNNKSREGIYHSLRYRYEEEKDDAGYRYVNVCMADSEKIVLNDVEQDLYENTIYNVIKKTIDDSDCDGTLHIILDMPPSYENYSDRVLNHLLLDQTSSLYKDFEGGKFKTSKYDVNLYMISACSIAHVELNARFVKDFIRNYSYSSVLPKFNRENRFNLYFIVNDPNHTIDENRPIDPKEFNTKIKDLFKNTPKDYSHLYTGYYKFVRMSYQEDFRRWLSSSMPLTNSLIPEQTPITQFVELMNGFNKIYG